MHSVHLPSLCSVFYVSVLSASATETINIAREAKRNNSERGITGGLAFTGRFFTQVLEGPAQAVDATMQSIGVDRRHTNLTLLWNRSISARRYPHWAMAFALAPSIDQLIADLLRGPNNAFNVERLSDILAATVAARAVHQTKALGLKPDSHS